MTPKEMLNTIITGKSSVEKSAMLTLIEKGYGDREFIKYVGSPSKVKLRLACIVKGANYANKQVHYLIEALPDEKEDTFRYEHYFITKKNKDLEVIEILRMLMKQENVPNEIKSTQVKNLLISNCHLISSPELIDLLISDKLIYKTTDIYKYCLNIEPPKPYGDDKFIVTTEAHISSSGSYNVDVIRLALESNGYKIVKFIVGNRIRGTLFKIEIVIIKV